MNMNQKTYVLSGCLHCDFQVTIPADSQEAAERELLGLKTVA
jgi:hypothetical protein